MSRAIGGVIFGGNGAGPPPPASTTPSAANGTNATTPSAARAVHFFPNSPDPVIAGTPSAGTPAREHGGANVIQPSPATIQPSPAPSASAAGNQALVAVERLAKLQIDAAKQEEERREDAAKKEEERREQTARREERVDHALADLAGHVKVLASEVKGLKEGLAETKETTKELEEGLKLCESTFENFYEMTRERDYRVDLALDVERTKRGSSHDALLVQVMELQKLFEELKGDFYRRKKNEEESL